MQATDESKSHHHTCVPLQPNAPPSLHSPNSPETPQKTQTGFSPSLSLFLNNHQFSYTPLQNPTLSPSSQKPNDTHLDSSSISPGGIAKSVLLNFSDIWGKKIETKDNHSLKDLLLKLSNTNPETTRRFLRVSELKTEDVLEILLGSQFECKKFEVEVEKVKSLWGIFKWGSAQGKGFKHLPKSFELMAKMLVRVRLFKEIEFLLYTMDSEEIQLDSDEIFSNLIEGYVGARELNRAISVYDQLRRQALVPSRSCYRAILDFLVEKNETHLALRVCTDMVEMGLGLSGEGTGIYENVIKLLCRDGKVKEARNLVRKVVAVGFKPSNSVIGEIASEYCEKKDYDDLLKFLVETDCALDVVVGNKVIFLLCRNFGVERANCFVQELENVGFRSDEITFGILIGWSCHEGKLQNAFVYLSEMLSRSLKPDVRSYNALIGGVFKEGMWKHAREILSEMHDVGVKPSLDTYKALLAGYSGARQFDEAKAVVGEMIQSGLIQPSSVSDFLLTAFMLLGLDPMKVKVRRDNDLGFSKTEFYDNLGNGLYLEADLSEYEKAITAVLEDSFVPDFNSVIMKDCSEGNYRTAVLMVEEMVRWGQELSPTSFSVLVKELCASNYNIKTIASLVDKMPKLTTQLDEDTLNVLVQALSRKGFTKNAMKVFGAMRQRHLTIKTETYTALCKKRKLMGLLGWKFQSRINGYLS